MTQEPEYSESVTFTFSGPKGAVENALDDLEDAAGAQGEEHGVDVVIDNG